MPSKISDPCIKRYYGPATQGGHNQYYDHHEFFEASYLSKNNRVVYVCKFCLIEVEDPRSS